LPKLISSKVYDLQPKEFDYKLDDLHDVGFIAEEVAKVEKNFAKYQNDEPVNINWNAIVASLVAEIKILQERIEKGDLERFLLNEKLKQLENSL